MNGSFIWYKNFGRRLFRYVTMHELTDRQTDLQTDRHTERRQKDHTFHSQSHGKKLKTAVANRNFEVINNFFALFRILCPVHKIHVLR